MHIKKNLGTALLLLLGSLSMTFCANPTEKKEEKATEIIEEVAVATPQSDDLTFVGENGEPVTLSSLKGKVVFINFWATWCPPCIQEMPSIDQLKSKFKGNENIVFLMVDVDNEIEKSSAFMKDNKYNLPVFVTTDDIPPAYLGNAIPTTVLLDKEGKIASRMEGSRDYDSPEMVKALNDLIAK